MLLPLHGYHGYLDEVQHEVIADEAHDFKNHSSEISRLLRAQESEKITLATATPMLHSVQEVIWLVRHH
ncbi:SNF2-like protein [Penicillium soppii]|uniref:SNF2-like protein n=1 Tax=Penicillium soppii TaxID=69789 RepID=UPI002549ADBE|nr:SNF2-like protein [Penicillium soppii]KAJ5863798.1 SNF2-like protein [Penicillium soppii]